MIVVKPLQYALSYTLVKDCSFVSILPTIAQELEGDLFLPAK